MIALDDACEDCAEDDEYVPTDFVCSICWRRLCPACADAHREGCE